MRKLFLFIALLTLSVGMWAIDRNQVVEEINNAAVELISALPEVLGQRNKDKGQKIMHKGQVVIRQGEKKYNVFGTQIE